LLKAFVRVICENKEVIKTWQKRPSMEDTMQKQKKLTILSLLFTLLLAACAGAVQNPGRSQTAAPATTQPAMGAEAAAQAMGETPEAMPTDQAASEMEQPDFFSAEFVQPSSGEVYTINDFQGKVVLVETLAMWCSNCLQQQKQVKALHKILGERDDFVSIGLDIDPNEEIDMLKEYTARHGFDWMYAIAPREVAREIAQRYGDQFLNPPSTPMFIIDRHGEVHPLPFGIKESVTLKDYLEPFLNSEM
jgi:cytochrome oxidase Cu insertion factor (SCO1/SenC/PrrC family)